MGALLTPVVVARIRKDTWVVALFLISAVALMVPGALYTRASVLVTAFVLGATAQGIKVCVDTLVQETVEDIYRGRVFSLYDGLFNVTLVGATMAAAATLPPTGRSYAVLAAVALPYALVASAYGQLTGVWSAGRAR